jgi:hypothetical protein
MENDEQLKNYTLNFTLEQLAGMFWLSDMGYSTLMKSITKDRLERSEFENQYLNDLEALKELNVDEVANKITEIYELLKTEYETYSAITDN